MIPSVLLLLSCLALPSMAQPAAPASVGSLKVGSPVEGLLRQARDRHAAHAAGMLKPLGSHATTLSATGGGLAALRNPFAAPPTQTKAFRADGNKEIWGAVINRTSWADLDQWSRPYGAYSFNTSAGTLTALGTDTYSMNFNGGAVFYGDALHGVNYYEYDGTIYSVSHYKYNTSDWSQDWDASTYAYDDFSAIAYAVAYDPTSGKVYAFNRDNSGTAVNFSTLDYSVPKAEKISGTERTYVALAIDADGKAYAIGLDGTLYAIDKATGAATAIGATGVTPGEAMQSAAFDQKDGTLYWAAINSDLTSSLYTIDTATGAATKVLDFADGEEMVALYVPVSADPGAPGDAQNLATAFEGGSLTGTVSFDVPTTTAGGTELTGDITYYIIGDDIDTLATGLTTAGAHVTESVTMASAGKHKVTVVLRNSVGDGKAVSVETAWVGPDVPYDTDNVTLTIDSTGHAVLAWEPVTTGWNEGFIDLDNITYTVYDDEGDTLAVHTKATRLEFDLTKGSYRPYRYIVRTYNGDVESEWGYGSNTVKWGFPLDVPYENTITTFYGFSILDIIDANNDGHNFRYSGRGAIDQGDIYGEHASDDWIVLPPITLQAGHAYWLSFDAAAVTTENTQKVEAAWGTDLNVAAYTTFINPTTTSVAGDGLNVRGLLRVTADGVYRLGIHDISDAQEDGGLIIRNVKVTEGPSMQAPDSVTAIRLTPDAAGLLKVSGTFTAPTATIGGDALASPVQVEVYRGDSLVQTITGIAPGAQGSFTDEGMPAGSVSYTLVASNEAGQGIGNTATTIVGVDWPAAPGNVAISDHLDGSAVMTWDAPTIGRNGRAIIQDELTYNVYLPDGATLFQSGLTDRSLAFSGLPTDGDQYATGLYVAAQNSVGEGDKALGLVFAGAPYTLPFKESFANGTPAHATWFGLTANSFQLFTTMAQDDDQGCMAFIPQYLGQTGIVTSGKISLAGSDKPKLSFWYWGVPRTDAEIKVLIGRNGIANPDTVKTVSLDNGDQGWQRVMADLTPYKADSYITVQFQGMSRNSAVPPIIDNITIDEAADNDLAVRLNAPSRVNVGANTRFQVKVSNEGNNDAHDAVVSLFVDDSLAATKTVSVAAASVIYPDLEWVVPASLKDEAKVVAQVEWAPDGNTANNISDEATVKIIRQDIPTVAAEGQTGEDLKPVLSWQAPSAEPYKYTESFENYDAFSIANVGLWTLTDLDSTEVGAIGGTYYDHMYEPCAYMVFNPELAGLNLAQLPQFAAHTGDQYMTTFSCGTASDNDDWLISPELSGKAQTISFWCRSVSGDSGLEEYEVLYSTTGTSTDDFTVVRENGTAPADGWTQVTVDLPEGARRFAIHCNSSNQFMFMVDDVTYQGQPVTVTAYNIYRNGQKVATVAPDATTWRDETAQDGGSYVYNVTVVTAQGESDFSNDVQILVTGIHATPGTQAGIHRWNIAGQRVDKARKGVVIERQADGTARKVAVGL